MLGKIIAGRYYKTRYGRKAYVYTVDAPNESHPIDGRVEHNATSDPLSWTPDGRYVAVGNDHSCDLVSEWREPVVHEVRGFVNVYSHTRPYLHLTREEARQHATAGLLACVEVYGKVTEGET